MRGVIFDLDGTLVDSALDFAQIRREMGLLAGSPILEALDGLDAAESGRCRAILARHEAAGAERATLMPGVCELLARLDSWRLKRAIITRNSRHSALATLARLGLSFELVVAREDAPIKPDPAPVRHVCAAWQLDPREVLVVGDYRFDIDAGLAAGAWTALYTRGRAPEGLPVAAEAHFVVRTFDELARLLESRQR